MTSAAILFIDAIHRYSEFPDGYVQFHDVVRFMSWTYYKGKQARVAKRLTKTTQEVAMRFFAGPMRMNLLDALYRILGSSLVNEGLVEATGALKLLRKFLKSTDARVQATMGEHLDNKGIYLVFHSLRRASDYSSGVMNEDIVEFLTEVLANSNYMQYIRKKAQWPGLVGVVEHCVARPDHKAAMKQVASEALAGSQVLVTSLAHVCDLPDTDLSIKVPQLLMEVGAAVSDTQMNSLLVTWDRLLCGYPAKIPISHKDYKESNTSIEHMLTSVGQNAQYASELSKLVDKIFLYLLETSRTDRLREVITIVKASAFAPTTAGPMASIILDGLIRLFKHELVFRPESLKFKTLFESLCEVAGHSVAAIEILFRIRKDVAGTLYLSSAMNEPEAIILDAHLPVTKWFQALCDVFQSKVRTREVFEYALKATSSLLGNHLMFASESDFTYIRIILDTVTRLLMESNPVSSSEGLGLSRIDVAAHLVQILTTIMSYHGRGELTKQEIHGLVSTLDRIAGSQGHVVTIQCIHALTICCYEVPAAMSRNMDGIINTMSRLVTQQHLAIHILQFAAIR